MSILDNDIERLIASVEYHEMQLRRCAPSREMAIMQVLAAARKALHAMIAYRDTHKLYQPEPLER